MNSCNQVTIHFAGFVSTKFCRKPKITKLYTLGIFNTIKTTISICSYQITKKMELGIPVSVIIDNMNCGWRKGTPWIEQFINQARSPFHSQVMLS